MVVYDSDVVLKVIALTYNKIKEVFKGFNKWIPNYTQEI